MVPVRPQGLNLLLCPPIGPPPQFLMDSSPELVHAARSWAHEFVTHGVPDVPEERLNDVVLVVSELVTNAVRYGTEPGDSLRVVLAAAPGLVRIKVQDPCRRRPRRKPESAERQRGRGLFNVDALAHDWGVDDRPMGKSVWAELRWQVTE
ncbi:anti-sigma regulatory factor [Streptomyces sp. NBC_00091]|uniref:ATP-binding protein n=1 Tax=Streptomyces sp. NBC_00091 TaxID=2975648 RepID=UPI002254F6A1|nr:ATP-binding protein [Streptomyces sp. NBC_00091]MCX5377969.1 ATP-binding protein [Streptomyces sp. NBC_00091]